MREDAMIARATQISIECNQLGENTEVLLKLINELEGRLIPLLRSKDEEKFRTANEPELTTELVPHASFLRTRNDLVKLSNSKLENILHRLEL